MAGWTITTKEQVEAFRKRCQALLTGRGGLAHFSSPYNLALVVLPEALDEIDYLRASFEITQEIIKEMAKAERDTGYSEGLAAERALLRILQTIENQLAVRPMEKEQN